MGTSISLRMQQNIFCYNYNDACLCICYLEEPCVIETCLSDQDITEGQSIDLSVTLSKARQVTWVKNSSPIPRFSARFRASVSESGLNHLLRILDAKTEDGGEYTAQVEDDRNLSSSCRINVQGNLTVIIRIKILLLLIL